MLRIIAIASSLVGLSVSQRKTGAEIGIFPRENLLPKVA